MQPAFAIRETRLLPVVDSEPDGVKLAHFWGCQTVKGFPQRGLYASRRKQNFEFYEGKDVTLPSESVSHKWLSFVVVVAVEKLESVFCFPAFP
jgi:hypothetical protein